LEPQLFLAFSFWPLSVRLTRVVGVAGADSMAAVADSAATADLAAAGSPAADPHRAAVFRMVGSAAVEDLVDLAAASGVVGDSAVAVSTAARLPHRVVADSAAAM